MKILLRKSFDNDYLPIIDAVNGRDTPISFDELQEKLINKELSLHQRTTYHHYWLSQIQHMPDPLLVTTKITPHDPSGALHRDQL